MKKTVNIKKKIEFSSMIGEICAISLDNHLKFVDDENIKGDFVVYGRYKSTAASRIEEDFQYEIPVEIALSEKVDSSTGTIDIMDFYYDIADGNSILCNIEIMVDAPEILSLDRECDGDSIEEKEIEIPHLEELNETEKDGSLREEGEENAEVEIDSTSNSIDLETHDQFLFNIDVDKETFGTFVVYIVRQNETINSIIEKYHTSVEEIEKYNNIKDLSIGTKIIIPLSNEQNT